MFVVVVIDLALIGETTLFFDLAFVATCVVAALTVRPRDFFAIGVLPPLLMLGTVLILAVVARGAIAEAEDGLVQAVVSGLAHHAGSLTTGYGLTLALLAVRQAAAKHNLPGQVGTHGAATTHVAEDRQVPKQRRSWVRAST